VINIERALRTVHPRPEAFNDIYVDYKPLVKAYDDDQKKTLDSHIDEIIVSLSPKKLKHTIIPADIMKKGKEMVEVYLYIYFIENCLRVLLNKYQQKGQLVLSIEMKRKITNRKGDEEKHLWLPLRGQSDLFYLDLTDIEKLIGNNWELFKGVFPDLKWITSKISELQKIRNLVAHNSYIEDNIRNFVKINLDFIVKQIQEKT